MDNKEWLDSLKAGDTVYVSQDYGLPPSKRKEYREMP